MKLLVAILLFFILPLSVCSQTARLDWAKQYSGNSFDGGQAITLDAQGNVYATGYFSTTTDFDPGPGVYNLTAKGAEDIFITKTSPAGELIWAKVIGDFRYQAGYAITLDNAGNVIVTGIFFGTVDFDPGPGEMPLVSAGNEDVFILKLKNNGDFIWAKKIGGPTNQYSNGVITDIGGSIYFNGYYDGTCNFDTENGIFNLTAAGATDIYVCKLTANGSLIWAKSIGGISSESAYGIGLDNEYNVYSTGFFFGNADFDPGTAIFPLEATGFGDGFLVKLNANGNFINAARLGGTNQVRCTNLKVDASSGFVYATGYFDGNADFDPGNGVSSLAATIGEEDGFVAKYDKDFNLIWAKQFSGPSFQRVLAVDTDAGGNVYTTGYFDVTTDFDPGAGSYVLTAGSISDAFICKLNQAGNFLWAAALKGAFFEGGYAIKYSQAGEVYILGTFNDATDFDPSAENFIMTAAGESEVFLAKYKQCSSVAIEQNLTITSCTNYTLNNKVYNQSGLYEQEILSTTGCDSVIIKLQLTITRIVNSVNKSICAGATWYAGGKWQTQSGVYTDTIKTTTGCDSIVITNLTVNASPKPDIGVNRNLCTGQVTILNPGKFNSYLWQDGSTLETYTVTTPGLYKVTVRDANNCAATVAVQFKGIVAIPANFLPPVATICNDNSASTNISGYKNYLWNDGNTQPIREFDKAGTYILSVTDFDNCIGKDTIVITAASCINTAIPNSFTPNGDGLNDIFQPVINTRFSNYILQIFNRGGKKIFESTTSNIGWNGTYKQQAMSAGAYVYHLKFNTQAGKTQNYTGSIILIR